MEDTKLSNGVGVEGDIETGSIGGESGRGAVSCDVPCSDSREVETKGLRDRTMSFFHLYQPHPRKPKEYHSVQTVLLAYQSLGIVYGDLGTSPLYVFSSIRLSNPGEEDLLGIFSLIFWTLTSIALIKYVFVVLRADDHGEGGTFALYSFLCRHINFQSKLTIHNTRLDSDAKMKYYTLGSRMKSKTKELLERSLAAQSFLSFVVLLGTCMVIGDGALTPATSVLSALQGIQSVSSSITQKHVIIMAVVLLVALFIFQQCGTSKVSFSFSPIMLMWFGSNIAIGVYNIVKYEPSVFKALSPHYIIIFFSRNGVTGWTLLGAIFLCITGAEAMFADLGHFNKNSIQLAFSSFVYPALVITYAGEAAYLIKHPHRMGNAFYSSIPEPVYWPMFVVSTLAAIVASQSMISATFSIVKQSLALGCFPRVNMVHTSSKHEGQVYSPEINYTLMIICIALVVGFQDGVQLGNAFGVVVVWVMIITTCLITLVMLVIWDTNLILVSGFFTIFVTIEGVYMTSLLNKVPQGGWAPFAISAFFLTVMLSWTYGRSQKSIYEAQQKMSLRELDDTLSRASVQRPQGICFFCTDLVNGIPPIIRRYIHHVNSVREIMVIVTVRTLPITTVLPEERLVVGKLGLDGVYRCLVQFGYKDLPSMEGDDYVSSVVAKLCEQAETTEEMEKLDSAMKEGVVFVMGRTILKANKNRRWLLRFTINYLYRFLQKNCRSGVSTLKVPQEKTLQVGMFYEI
ncbi:unnamed protein product [Camellia sinensis]